jgi:hypothetical protein
MPPMLRLYEDVLGNEAELPLPARPRMIFVVHGSGAIADRSLQDEGTFAGEGAVTLKAGSGGATVWRWELAADETGSTAAGSRSVITREKLATRLETLPQGALLLRGDSVAFPPGGCAYRHRHQGPGIRCLLEGGASTPTADRPPTAPAAPGTRPAPMPCSLRPRNGRPASSAS